MPERRKKSQNGQILEVEAMRRCVISRFGDYGKNLRNICRDMQIFPLGGQYVSTEKGRGFLELGGFQPISDDREKLSFRIFQRYIYFFQSVF